jgi:hypothetical protein
MFIDRVRFRESEEDSVEPRLLPPRAAEDANERTFVEEVFFFFFQRRKNLSGRASLVFFGLVRRAS